MGRLTVEARCLLYLLDRADVSEDDPTAQELVQERIAEAVKVRRAHASRTMGRLGSQGLVKTAKVRVPGQPRRRLAYFLTDEGLRRAKELRQRLEEEKVVVVDFEGRESERRLYEIPLLLPRRPKFSELLAGVEAGRLDLGRFLDRQARLHSGKTYDVDGAITHSPFCGRGTELGRLQSFLEDRRARGCLIVGLPGIGKTTVVSRWVLNLKGRLHIVWRRVRPETTAHDLLRDLAAVLHSVGRPALSNYMRRPPDGAPDASIDLLKRSVSGINVLLVLDDAHVARDDVGRLVRELLTVEPGSAGLKQVIISRERVPFVRAEDVARGVFWEIELGDLPPADADAMLAARGVDEARRPRILSQCGGHPLSLELASAGGMPLEGVSRVSAAWLAQEVLPRIGSAVRQSLNLAVVFEGPVPRKLLGGHATELARLCLLREVDGDRLDVHDIVREAIVHSLAPERLAALHRRSAELLAGSREPREVLEAVRHFVLCEAFREGTALAADRGQEIIDAGLAEAFLPLLERLSWAARGTSVEPRFSVLQGHALFALGRSADAARVYERCSTIEDERTAAEALLGQGKAEVQRRSQLALSLLLSARDRLEGLGHLRLLAEAQYWIGAMHENENRLDEARESFERGRAVAFDVGDRRWEGLCAYGIGRLRSVQGDFEGAVDEEREALKLLERGGHRLEIAKACTGLGGNLLELGRLEEAEPYLVRAIDEARATGALGILAPSLYNLASLRNQAGRMKEALPMFEQAFEAFWELEHYDRAAWCSAWLAYGAWSQKKEALGDEYARRADSLLSRISDSALRAKALRHMARAASKAGRKAEARRYFIRAMVEARTADLSPLEADLGTEMEKLG